LKVSWGGCGAAVPPVALPDALPGKLIWFVARDPLRRSCSQQARPSEEAFHLHSRPKLVRMEGNFNLKQQREKEEAQELEFAAKSSLESVQNLQREKERQNQQLARINTSSSRRREERTPLHQQGESVFGNPRDKRQVILTSAPALTFEKPGFPKLGRTQKTSLKGLKMAEAKMAAEGVMSSIDPDMRPRYAKVEKAGRRQMQAIEVLEVDGDTVLGVPNTSTLRMYATQEEGSDEHRGPLGSTTSRRHIFIAMHGAKGAQAGAGGGGGNKHAEESANIRSGAAALQKALMDLREELAASRSMHNMFNEIPKYAVTY